MNARLNIALETAKHERLIKLLDMIRKCDEYIERESKFIDMPEARGWQSKWLFQSKEKWMENLRFKIAVRNRISAYYAKQVFALASNAYNTITLELKPQMPTVAEFMQPIATICEDYKQRQQFSKQ